MSDLDTLEQVFALAEKRKLRISAVSVGSIRLIVSSEGEAPKLVPKTAIEAMRERGRRLFGRNIPDEQLKELEGVL